MATLSTGETYYINNGNATTISFTPVGRFVSYEEEFIKTYRKEFEEFVKEQQTYKSERRKQIDKILEI